MPCLLARSGWECNTIILISFIIILYYCIYYCHCLDRCGQEEEEEEEQKQKQRQRQRQRQRHGERSRLDRQSS